MIHRMLFVGVVIALVLASPEAADSQFVTQNPSDITVINATNVFATSMMMPQNEIPRSLLANAQAIAIVPGMVRGAFVFGVQHGRGVLVLRDAAGNWQPPRFIQITGGSIGYQIGVQATDLVLVFRTPQSVQNLLRGTLKVGVDASAAAGPIGRQTSASTDIALQAEILSYSRARGAFVGVSIDGSSITLDPQAEAIYYQQPGVIPASATQLLQTITSFAAPVPMVMAPDQVTAGGGWVPAGGSAGNTEVVRQQLDRSSRQLVATLDASSSNIADVQGWKQFLALPPEVFTPNQTPSPETLQPILARYEQVARDPRFGYLTARPEFQESLVALRSLSAPRTASNPSPALPAPPR